MQEPNMALTRKRILIVDDDAGQRSLLESFLTGRGFDIVTAASGEQALNLLHSHKINMVISDVRMPGISGLETMRQARENHKTLPILLVTAYADIRDAVSAMRDGAVNYLEKPIDLDELLASVQHAVGIEASQSIPIPEELHLPPQVVAHSPITRKVFHEVFLVASSESRILITGDSGTGKEVVADMIHAWSSRSSGPLIKVNCAALPENLLESEWFGHEKGAFTGASVQRIGRFEEANEGTILLDEIAELSPALQAKLLRVVQDGTFQRVGSNTDRQTHARILASTNRNLELEVQAKRFREDLFFRLNVMEIYMPTLRERKADIIPLANLFAAQFSQGKPRFSAEVAACLELYEWPGNVRELRNAMERATLMARGDVILIEHLPLRIQKTASDRKDKTDLPGTQRESRMEEIERITILSTLREHKYNRTETARTLGISRRALIYKLQRFKDQGYNVESE